MSNNTLPAWFRGTLRVLSHLAPRELRDRWQREWAGTPTPPGVSETAITGERPPLLTPFLQDFRFGLRTLGKSPWFSLVTILTLALGIGAGVAMFGVLHSVFLRPLPFPVEMTVRGTGEAERVAGNVLSPNLLSALGAPAGRVGRMVLRQGLALVAMGALVGLAGAWGAVRSDPRVVLEAE